MELPDDIEPVDIVREHLQKMKRTAIHKKMVTYLRGLTDDMAFMQKVHDIRKKHGLPENGHPYQYEERHGDFYEKPFFRAPEGFYEDVELLAREYKIQPPFEDYLEELVIHNNLDVEIYYGFREIVDLKKMITGPFRNRPHFDIEQSTLKEVLRDNPIAFLINPYSSERDLINYIQMTYKKVIKPLQDKYREPHIKIGKIKKRSQAIQDRNNYIYEHRDMPISKLVATVNKQYKVNFDYTYIQKIIAKERRKRSVNGKSSAT